MEWMKILTTGLGFLGGLSGLLGGNAREKQEEQAEQAAVRDLTTSQDEQYLSTQGAGIEGLYGLTGRLNEALGVNARGLGAAEAGAGVYNSSAVAGAVANESAANAGAEASYASNLSNVLANLKAKNNAEAAQIKAGFAQNNLNYARQLSAGGVNGMSSALSSIAQMNFGKAARPNPNVLGQSMFPGMPQDPNLVLGPGVNPVSGNYFSQGQY